MDENEQRERDSPGRILATDATTDAAALGADPDQGHVPGQAGQGSRVPLLQQRRVGRARILLQLLPPSVLVILLLLLLDGAGKTEQLLWLLHATRLPLASRVRMNLH